MEANEQISLGEGDFSNQHVSVLPNSNSHSHSHSTKCTSDDDEESSSITSDSGHIFAYNAHNQSSSSPAKMKMGRKVGMPFAPGEVMITPTAITNPMLETYKANPEFEQLCTKLLDRANEIGRLRNEIDQLKTQSSSDISIVNMNLQDEKYRVEVCSSLLYS